MLSEWVHQAAKLPIAFAQVREDPALDLAVLEEVGAGARIIMVASGGCTAAALAASQRASSIHLVDVNPAQVALARLKLLLLETANSEERLALLGHRAMPAGKRARLLSAALTHLDLSPGLLGDEQLLCRMGPDHLGRCEFFFAELRSRLRHFSGELQSLMEFRDTRQQSRAAEPQAPLGVAIDNAFEQAFATPDIVHVFGSDMMRNSLMPFSRHFSARLRDALATLPARDNPFLAQSLLGRFQDGAAYPWFYAQSPDDMPCISWSVSSMQEALASSDPESYDLVHLSNVTDWLEGPAAAETLDLASRALRKDGIMILRQLNSSLDIPALGARFIWEPEMAARLHRQDRSYFYRLIHIGRKA
jgi:S-adenosylmethionine-diacylglycerol 3-amino-3-carboxypropyl transferase